MLHSLRRRSLARVYVLRIPRSAPFYVIYPIQVPSQYTGKSQNDSLYLQ